MWRSERRYRSHYMGSGRESELENEILLLRESSYANGFYARKLARRYRLLNVVLTLASAMLAAAAGFTALPADIARWVTSFLAFFSALIGFVTAAFSPLRAGRRQAMLAARWNRLGDDVARLQRSLSGQNPPSDPERNFERLLERRDRLEHDAAVGDEERDERVSAQHHEGNTADSG